MGTASDLINARTVVMPSSTEFADLYERHYAAVYRAALRVTGNPSDAEDVLQTVFSLDQKTGGSVDGEPILKKGLRSTYRPRSHVRLVLELRRAAP